LSLTAKTLLGVAAAALFLLGLGAAPFGDPPEGFHAAVARDMLRVGDWITPQVDGVRYFDKPPLFYWLLACALPPPAGPYASRPRGWLSGRGPATCSSTRPRSRTAVPG
jgi:4-amino-4-deoxy-L-arabinose transferase-like glycosyltransferase